MFGLSQEADSVQNAAGLQGAGHDSLLLLPAVYNFRHYWTTLSVINWQLYTKNRFTKSISCNILAEFV